MSDPAASLNPGSLEPAAAGTHTPDLPFLFPLAAAASVAMPAPAPADAPALSDDATAHARAEWKDELRRDFEAWLATLEDVPPAAAADADAPDLYSFYAQLVAASAESRRANRRTAEAMSQWGETLARFESGLQPLRETAAQLLAAQPKEKELPRAHCLMLVEVLDRAERLARAFAKPPAPKPAWWRGHADAGWRTAWETQRQAIDILVSHLEALLRKEGVVRVETVGQPFDPAVMLAVATQPDAALPPQTVVEVVNAGYRRHDELLRPAHVIVSSTA